MEGVFVGEKKFKWGFHFEEECLLHSLSLLIALRLTRLNVKALQIVKILQAIYVPMLLPMPVLILVYATPQLIQMLLVRQPTLNVQNPVVLAHVRILVKLHAVFHLIVHMTKQHRNALVILLSTL